MNNKFSNVCKFLLGVNKHFCRYLSYLTSYQKVPWCKSTLKYTIFEEIDARISCQIGSKRCIVYHSTPKYHFVFCANLKHVPSKLGTGAKSVTSRC